MQMMYKLDSHPSCDKVQAHTGLHSEKDVGMIAINRGHRSENFERTSIRIVDADLSLSYL